MKQVIETAVKMLKRDEGWREFPYYCPANCPTVGYGFKLAEKGEPLPSFRITREVGDVWLTTLVEGLYNDLKDTYDFSSMGIVRSAVLLSMAYQLGVSGLEKFKKTNKLIGQNNFYSAAIEMLDSKWAREDSPERAIRYSRMFKGNALHYYYGE